MPTQHESTNTPSLESMMDDFVERPTPPLRRDSYRERRPAVTAPPKAPPAVCDAFVLFVKRTHCLCGCVFQAPSFLSLRRPIAGGYAYIAYCPSFVALAAQLPRLTIETVETVNYCHVCFHGEPSAQPDVSFERSVSRSEPIDDLRAFVGGAIKSTNISPKAVHTEQINKMSAEGLFGLNRATPTYHEVGELTFDPATSRDEQPED